MCVGMHMLRHACVHMRGGASEPERAQRSSARAPTSTRREHLAVHTYTNSTLRVRRSERVPAGGRVAIEREADVSRPADARRGHVELPVGEARLWQVHTHTVQRLPLRLVDLVGQASISQARVSESEVTHTADRAGLFNGG